MRQLPEPLAEYIKDHSINITFGELEKDLIELETFTAAYQALEKKLFNVFLEKKQDRLLIAALAYEFFAKGKSHFTHAEVVEFLGKMGYQEEIIVLSIAIKTGLIKEGEQQQYHFIDSTIQQYYAAIHVANILEDSVTNANNISANRQSLQDQLLKQKLNSQWQRVWWFVAGLLQDNPMAYEHYMGLLQGKVGKESIAFNPDLMGQYELGLLSKCCDEARRETRFRDTMEKRLQQTVAQWFNLIKEHSDLPADYSPTFIQGLHLSLFWQKQSGEHDLFCQVNGLEEVTGKAFIEIIHQLRLASSIVVNRLVGLLSDEDKYVRSSAAEALVKLGFAVMPEVLAHLTRLLSDGDWFIRSSVAEVLRWLGSAAATPEVVAHLTRLLSDGDWFIRSKAAKALGRLGPAAATPEVLAGLTRSLSDEKANVRYHAAKALGNLGPAAATPEVVAHLTLLLSDKEKDVRYSVAETLGRLGPAAAPELLLYAIDVFRKENIRLSNHQPFLLLTKTLSISALVDNGLTALRTILTETASIETKNEQMQRITLLFIVLFYSNARLQIQWDSINKQYCLLAFDNQSEFQTALTPEEARFLRRLLPRVMASFLDNKFSDVDITAEIQSWPTLENDACLADKVYQEKQESEARQEVSGQKEESIDSSLREDLSASNRMSSAASSANVSQRSIDHESEDTVEDSPAQFNSLEAFQIAVQNRDALIEKCIEDLIKTLKKHVNDTQKPSTALENDDDDAEEEPLAKRENETNALRNQIEQCQANIEKLTQTVKPIHEARIKQEAKEQEKERLLADPELGLYYRTVYGKLLTSLTAFRALGDGKIKGDVQELNKYNRSKSKKAITLLSRSAGFMQMAGAGAVLFSETVAEYGKTIAEQITPLSEILGVIGSAGEFISRVGAGVGVVGTVIGGGARWLNEKIVAEKLDKINQQLSDPRFTDECLAEEVARLLTHCYVSQIRCLKEESIKFFAQCGVERINYVLADKKLLPMLKAKESSLPEALAQGVVFIQLNNIKQGRVKIKPVLASQSCYQKWTESGIYCKSGMAEWQEDMQQWKYYSNDATRKKGKKDIKPNSEGPETRANKYGYRVICKPVLGRDLLREDNAPRCDNGLIDSLNQHRLAYQPQQEVSDLAKAVMPSEPANSTIESNTTTSATISKISFFRTEAVRSYHHGKLEFETGNVKMAITFFKDAEKGYEYLKGENKLEPKERRRLEKLTGEGKYSSKKLNSTPQ